jgi:hypothetical protein
MYSAAACVWAFRQIEWFDKAAANESVFVFTFAWKSRGMRGTFYGARGFARKRFQNLLNVWVTADNATLALPLSSVERARNVLREILHLFTHNNASC